MDSFIHFCHLCIFYVTANVLPVQIRYFNRRACLFKSGGLDDKDVLSTVSHRKTDQVFQEGRVNCCIDSWICDEENLLRTGCSLDFQFLCESKFLEFRCFSLMFLKADSSVFAKLQGQ